VRVSAIKVVLDKLLIAAARGRLPDAASAHALTEVQAALTEMAAVVDKCRSLGELGAAWHAHQIVVKFRLAQQVCARCVGGLG
jgi:hypothetical protein